MKYLIVGLGNPGVTYELTRHNVGFLILDRLADQNKLKFEQGRYGFWTLLKHKGRSIYLLKPTTFMNLSGKAVNYWQKELAIPKSNLIVATDDQALPYGKLRIRKKGSSGGHNGLKNIEESLFSTEYPRLRFGVSNDFQQGQQVDYVLSPFGKEQLKDLVVHMDSAIEALMAFCTIGIELTMTQHNG